MPFRREIERGQLGALHDRVFELLNSRSDLKGKVLPHVWDTYEIDQAETIAKQRESREKKFAKSDYLFRLLVDGERRDRMHIAMKTKYGDEKLVSIKLKPAGWFARRRNPNATTIEVEPHNIPPLYRPLFQSIIEEIKSESHAKTIKPILPQDAINKIKGFKDPIATIVNVAAQHLKTGLEVSGAAGNVGLVHKRPYVFIEEGPSEKTGGATGHVTFFEDFSGRKVGSRNSTERNQKVDDAFWKEVADRSKVHGADWLRFIRGKYGKPHVIELYKPDAELLAGVILDTFSYVLPRHKIRIVKKFDE